MAKLFENPRSIAIEGPIRAGKSSLAVLVAEKIGAQCLLESNGNPFLPAFYRGEAHAAFSTQMWFLTSRYEQLRGATEKDARFRQHAPIVSDYIFEKDKIFASLNLSDEELAFYNRQYRQFRVGLPGPDLVIYLQASSRVLRSHIRRKGLADERAISDDYLDQVVAAYEHFFFHYSASDLLVVKTDDIDFIQNNRDLQTLLRRLTEPVRGTQYFLPMARGDGDGHHHLPRGIRREIPSLRMLTRGFAPGIAQAAQRLKLAF